MTTFRTQIWFVAIVVTAFHGPSILAQSGVATTRQTAPVAQLATMVPLPVQPPVQAAPPPLPPDFVSPLPTPAPVLPPVQAAPPPPPLDFVLPLPTPAPMQQRQQAPPAKPGQPRPGPVPPGTPAPTTPTAPVPPPPPPYAGGQPVNVRIEVAISDEGGTAAAVKKTVSMTVGDRENGQIRSEAYVSGQSVPLHVDARPVVLTDGKIRVSLVLNYNITFASGSRQPTREDMVNALKTEVREQLGFILESGKPMIVSQSADPISERRLTVEVKATVLR
jgi:hypothetical protein